MTTTAGNRGVGRPSKGERRFFGTRLPMDQANLLLAVAPAQGICVSDFIAATVVEKLETLSLGQSPDANTAE